MPNIPDAISPEELLFLSEQSENSGITPMGAEELVALAAAKIKELEKITKQLESCQNASIELNRWRNFDNARRCVRRAVASLKKCIAV